MAKLVERVSIKGDMLREPSIMEILRYRLRDAEFLGFITRPGWRGELPYYGVMCSVHGQVENYPQGFDEVLLCPHCDE